MEKPFPEMTWKGSGARQGRFADSVIGFFVRLFLSGHSSRLLGCPELRRAFQHCRVSQPLRRDLRADEILSRGLICRSSSLRDRSCDLLFSVTRLLVYFLKPSRNTAFFFFFLVCSHKKFDQGRLCQCHASLRGNRFIGLKDSLHRMVQGCSKKFCKLWWRLKGWERHLIIVKPHSERSLFVSRQRNWVSNKWLPELTRIHKICCLLGTG